MTCVNVQAPRSGGPWLINVLLEQQATAVDRFSRRHGDASQPQLSGHYRDLVPMSMPRAGEQFAFEVDLDACSGCKACVTACHNLNGLDAAEEWRSVGMLIGGSDQSPLLQHVTASCHHCIDPACLSGCPVKAYEKDLVTGIVRHLDDQCIGCRYCVFMCPYDVPQYNPSRGIVRKCDMCYDRLMDKEAPACVQACPTGAIRIRTVDQETIREESEASQFLPASPDPGFTLPTTRYKSLRAWPRSVLPADYYSASRQHSHLPLVFMLVLTQLSVGAFVVGHALVAGPWADEAMLAAIRPVYAVAVFLVGIVGMNAAVFHLGRPKYAFRALLGLRTSWLSREILAFGLFAGCALINAAVEWLASSRPGLVSIANTMGLATAASGLVGVACSVMVYVKTKRPFWSGHRTTGKFVLSCLVLGLPVALLILLLAGRMGGSLSAKQIMQSYGQTLCQWLMTTMAIKLGLESTVFLWLRHRQHAPMKRTALLLAGELGTATFRRYFFGVMGGMLLPLILLSHKAVTMGPEGFEPLFVEVVAGLSAALVLAGELTERYLFFAASAALKMPGTPCR